jgi:hypothetical protein
VSQAHGGAAMNRIVQLGLLLALLAACAHAPKACVEKEVSAKLPGYGTRPAVLVAKDGTNIAVDDATYQKTKEGDRICSVEWR